ncbi:MAG: AMP-binding protein [Nannocystaceae bacterium]
MYIGDWMERGERYWPERVAVVDVARGDAGRFTYRALNERADRLATWLRDQVGVGVGDRVGLLAHNGVEYLDALFACGKLGAILVPYNWREHWRELAERIAQTRPRALIFDPEFKEAVAEALSACPEVQHTLELGEAPEEALLAGSRGYERALASRPRERVAREDVDPEDIVCLLFTGGTTGRPKGARVSLRMIAWNTLNTILHELARGDVTITHTPMFHTGGLLVYTLPLLTLGGTVVIMRRWTADEMLALVERERVTVMFCVPTQYQLMMESPRFPGASFASVRFLTSGGAPLPVPVIEAYRARHGVAFKQGFGMTEFGPGIFSMNPEDADARAGSVGRPNYFVDARIIGDDGRALGPGEVGELVVRGPSMSSGYFGVHEDPRGAADEGGWFHTGDLARCDADGFYYIVDRAKDMFISGGENVYPVEVEAALYRHPAVALCAVVGVPDPRWGEVGVAYVVKKTGLVASADVDEEGLIAHCREHLARYKVPKAIRVRASLPTTPAGKILKRALADEARGEGSAT